MPILTDEERIGTCIAGKYRIDRLVGKGGIGAVFAATHQWTHRPVAVKILQPHVVQDPGQVQRLLREARAATSLRHPNVVDVLDMGNDDGTVYLVLELLEGEALNTRIERQQKLSVEETLKIVFPVLDALSVAHGMGMIHRDLKPDNIFLVRTADGGEIPKLLDFGLVKSAKQEGMASTQSGTIMGTPLYMPPEQAMGETDITPAADIYSMGAVLYECLTGNTPHVATTLAQLILLLTTKDPSPICQVNPSVPPALGAVIDRALRKAPTERFADAKEFASALQKARENPHVLPSAPPVAQVRIPYQAPSAPVVPQTPVHASMVNEPTLAMTGPYAYSPANSLNQTAPPPWTPSSGSYPANNAYPSNGALPAAPAFPSSPSLPTPSQPSAAGIPVVAQPVSGSSFRIEWIVGAVVFVALLAVGANTLRSSPQPQSTQQVPPVVQQQNSLQPTTPTPPSPTPSSPAPTAAPEAGVVEPVVMPQDTIPTPQATTASSAPRAPRRPRAHTPPGSRLPATNW